MSFLDLSRGGYSCPLISPRMNDEERAKTKKRTPKRVPVTLADDADRGTLPHGRSKRMMPNEEDAPQTVPNE